MIHYFVKYHADTGEISTVGHTSTPGELSLQADPQRGIFVVEADGPTIMNGAPGRETYCEAVRVHLCRMVDAEARALLDDPFEAIHAAQAAEARGSTPTPYLDALRAATGQTLKQAITAIKQEADAADARKAAVNAARQAAKQAIRTATSMADIVSASEVEWAA